MTLLPLIDLFDELVPPSGYTAGLVFNSLEIPGWPAYRIGKSSAGEPALLVRPANKSVRVAPPIKLQSLSVHHEALCRVSTKGAPLEENTFSVLLCTSSDSELQRYFLDVLGPLVLSMGARPTAEAIVASVTGLTELFRAISRASRESTQGVWAELLLMSLAKSPSVLARVWHLSPTDRFDFNAGDTRIEVKCASSSRRHHFALEQITPPVGTRAAVASVLTTRSGGGTTLRDVLIRAQDKLRGDAELQARLYQVVADTLGSGLAAGLLDAYDEQLAVDSLRYYWAETIPAPRGSVPTEVTEIRFVSDLSGIQPVPFVALKAQGGIFAAL